MQIHQVMFEIFQRLFQTVTNILIHTNDTVVQVSASIKYQITQQRYLLSEVVYLSGYQFKYANTS